MIVRSYNPIERGLPAVWIDRPIREPVQALTFLRQLREYPEGDEPIDVVLSGGGGNCSIALEMYTALREHPRRKRMTIFSAPSMSGVIAMAGDHIRIVEDGTIFLHPVGYAKDYVLNEMPWHVPATTLRSLARNCEATDALHLQIFARRTRLATSTIADLRARDTTLDAHQAVRLGFADEVIPCP